jgi:hypothetical protein
MKYALVSPLRLLSQLRTGLILYLPYGADLMRQLRREALDIRKGNNPRADILFTRMCPSHIKNSCDSLRSWSNIPLDDFRAAVLKRIHLPTFPFALRGPRAAEGSK